MYIYIYIQVLEQPGLLLGTSYDCGPVQPFGTSFPAVTALTCRKIHTHICTVVFISFVSNKRALERVQLHDQLSSESAESAFSYINS